MLVLAARKCNVLYSDSDCAANEALHNYSDVIACAPLDDLHQIAILPFFHRFLVLGLIVLNVCQTPR